MPGWLVLLCAYLLVWVPLNFAVLANRSLPSVGHRGTVAVLELAVHGIEAILCAAAGWMLRVRNPAGAVLARVALAANAALTLQALYVSSLPRDVRPGLALPLAVFSITHATAWIVYLARSRRVRSWLA
jgi:hypothetical protein